MLDDKLSRKLSCAFTFDQSDEAEKVLFELMAKSVPDQTVANSMEVSEAAIRAIRAVARMAIAAEAEAVDDLIALIEERHEQQASGLFLLGQSPVEERAQAEAELIVEAVPLADDSAQSGRGDDRLSLLEGVSRDLSSEDMRGLAGSLLKLADALDQDWAPMQVRSQYHWATRAGRLERNSIELAKIAVRVQELDRRRERHISPELLGEPSWRMLLELFIQFAGGAKVSTKSMCIMSGCPDTTALRVIDRLENAGLIKRSSSLEDKRVKLLELTQKGVVAVGSALQDLDC